MLETLQVVDGALHRAWVLGSHDVEIPRAAVDAARGEVVLCVDVRDPLGADLGARMLMAIGEMTVEEFDASLREAEERVAQFIGEQSGRVPLLTASVRREWLDDELRGRGRHDDANRLDANSEMMVVVVASGGVLVAPLLAHGVKTSTAPALELAGHNGCALHQARERSHAWRMHGGCGDDLFWANTRRLYLRL